MLLQTKSAVDVSVVVGLRTGGVECCGCHCHDQVNVDGVTYSHRANVKTVNSFVATT